MTALPPADPSAAPRMTAFLTASFTASSSRRTSDVVEHVCTACGARRMDRWFDFRRREVHSLRPEPESYEVPVLRGDEIVGATTCVTPGWIVRVHRHAIFRTPRGWKRVWNLPYDGEVFLVRGRPEYALFSFAAYVPEDGFPFAPTGERSGDVALFDSAAALYPVDVVDGDRVVAKGGCATPPDVVLARGLARVWTGGMWFTMRAVKRGHSVAFQLPEAWRWLRL